MKRNRKSLVILLLFALPLFAYALACGMVAPGLQGEVNEAAAHYSKEHNDTAVWLLVEKNGEKAKGAAGFADRQKQLYASRDQMFEIGSASKVFTGVAIFQLIEAGKLSLDTKLSQFYSKDTILKLADFHGKNYFGEVTVGMLLRHRSGFVDYLNVFGSDAKTIGHFRDKRKRYTFDDIVALAASHGEANFRPGEKFRYCNTGYIILGDIIEKVSGMSWRKYIRTHIIQKAGMEHTWFGSQMPEKLRQNMPQGHAGGKPTFMPPTLAGSAGEIVSTLDDLARFMKAWGEGRLYAKPKTLKFQMTQGFVKMDPAIENLKYGYAIMRIDGFYGHGGQTFGFQSYMAYNPKSKELYIVGTNDAYVSAMDLFFEMAGLKLRTTLEKLQK